MMLDCRFIVDNLLLKNLANGSRSFLQSGASVCRGDLLAPRFSQKCSVRTFQHRNQLLEICIDYREDNLIVEVIDDGPGVDSRDHELIFKRYTQLKSCVLLSRNGHGLGLAGARILARHLGGDITIKSRRGAGTVFCLSLPLKFSNE